MKRFLLASGVLLVCFVLCEYLTLPDVSSLKKENPQMTALMSQREREAKAAGTKARRYQLWIGY
ncbi:MAG TPA: monofunctional biosynthetic peptidoglycan transglycosylase, partial [Terriglobia bacterium]|nr:monofunctional biosynthetic peptidoglycan transglycosylase [Terriglobia bacterium]